MDLLRDGALPKGDALGGGPSRRHHGREAYSRPHSVVPPDRAARVEVALDLGDDAITVTATVRTADRTGVEMEALTAVAMAGLALIDMIKAVDPAAVIDRVRVLRKEGGKTGTWVRGGDR